MNHGGVHEGHGDMPPAPKLPHFDSEPHQENEELLKKLEQVKEMIDAHASGSEHWQPHGNQNFNGHGHHPLGLHAAPSALSYAHTPGHYASGPQPMHSYGHQTFVDHGHPPPGSHAAPSALS
jgi:hypothetical protein